MATIAILSMLRGPDGPFTDVQDAKAYTFLARKLVHGPTSPRSLPDINAVKNSLEKCHRHYITHVAEFLRAMETLNLPVPKELLLTWTDIHAIIMRNQNKQKDVKE